MFFPCCRLTAVVFLVVSLTLPSTVAAEPITDLTPLLVGDGFILYGGHALSVENLAVLAALHDNGLHLGWFKKKLRSSDGQAIDGSDFPTWPTLDGSHGLGSALGQHPLTPFPLIPGFPPGFPGLIGDPLNPVLGEQLENGPTSAAPIAAPEPTSLVLLGTGLLFLARRAKRRRFPCVS